MNENVFRGILIMAFCGVILQGYSQNYDSLYNTILQMPDDTAKVGSLNNLGYKLRKNNAPFAIKVAEIANETARAIGDTVGMIESEKIMGTAYTFGRDKVLALEHFHSGLDLAKASGDQRRESMILNNIGNLYFLTAKYDEALDYYAQSLKIRREINDLKGMASTLGNMGNIANAKLNDLDLAIEYYTESLEISKKLNNPELISTTYNNLGNIYRSRGDLQKALESQRAAMRIERSGKDYFGLTYTYSSIVMLHLDTEQNDSACFYAERLVKLADSLGNMSRRQIAYYRMSTALEAKGKYREALGYQRAYQLVRDSLKNTRTASQLAEVEAKYDNAVQYRELAELRNKNLVNEQRLKNQFNERLIWALAIVILLGSLRLLWLRVQKNKLKAEKLSQQKEILSKKSEETSRFNEIINKRNQELNETLNQLKQTQEKLLETEKVASIGILTSGLAHELNNPLNYVSGMIGPIKLNLAELESKLSDTSDVDAEMLINETTELLSSLSVGIEKITAIIRNLLDISPKIYPDQERAIALNKILESAVYGIQYNFPDVIFELESVEEVIIYGDYAELNQVFINLLKNAVDALEKTEDPKIHIALSKEGDVAKVCISDNGCGMDDDTVRDIFQPFYTTKAPGKGSGLGLYVSYGILKKYDGSIEVNSSKGNGTKFTIFLPVSEELTVMR